jgi:hypothetical protein
VRWSSSRVSSCGSSRRMTRRVRLENLHRKKQQVAPHVLITHHAPHTTRIMHHTSIHIYIYIYAHAWACTWAWHKGANVSVCAVCLVCSHVLTRLAHRHPS